MEYHRYRLKPPCSSLNFDLAKLCVEGFYLISFGTAAVAIVPPW